MPATVTRNTNGSTGHALARIIGSDMDFNDIADRPHMGHPYRTTHHYRQTDYYSHRHQPQQLTVTPRNAVPPRDVIITTRVTHHQRPRAAKRMTEDDAHRQWINEVLHPRRVQPCAKVLLTVRRSFNRDFRPLLPRVCFFLLLFTSWPRCTRLPQRPLTPLWTCHSHR